MSRGGTTYPFFLSHEWLGGKLTAAEFSPILSIGYPASRPSPLSITLPLGTVTMAGTITNGDNNYPTLLLSLSLPLILNKEGRMGKLVCQKPPACCTCVRELWLLSTYDRLFIGSQFCRCPLGGGFENCRCPYHCPCACLPTCLPPICPHATNTYMILCSSLSVTLPIFPPPPPPPPLSCSHFQPLPH